MCNSQLHRVEILLMSGSVYHEFSQVPILRGKLFFFLGDFLAKLSQEGVTG